MVDTVKCPRCGKNDIPNGSDWFCGPCELVYRNEHEQERLAEIAYLRTQAPKHAPGCDCSRCMTFHIQLLRLEGKTAQADALMNA